MSIHISLSYQKKKEDYNKEDVLGVCIFYYFNKKKIKISTGVKTKFKDWNFNWEKTHSKEIITLPILQTSEIGDLVLDPFMGSGTTGRVCDKLKRRFVGYGLRGF